MTTNETPVWTTQDGRRIPVDEMTEGHLMSTIAMLDRQMVQAPDDFPLDNVARWRDILTEEAGRRGMGELL